MLRKLSGESLGSVVHRNSQKIESLESVVHIIFLEIEWRKPRFYSAQKCSGN